MKRQNHCKKVLCLWALLLTCTVLLAGCGSPSLGDTVGGGKTAAPESAGTQPPAKPQMPAQPQNPAPEDLHTVLSEAADVSLVMQRQAMTDTGYLCAVAYLGDVTGELYSGVAGILRGSRYEQDIPFIGELPEGLYVDGGGVQVFCILPLDEKATVAINDWSEEDGTGEVLYRSEKGDPIILRCNPEEGISSTQLILTDSRGETIEYTPVTVNASLLSHPQVRDFTVYDGADGIMYGTWYGEGLASFLGEYVECELTIGQDARMSFNWISTSGKEASYLGYYTTAPDDDTILDVSLLMDPPSEDPDIPATITGSFWARVMTDGSFSWMELQWLGGDALGLMDTDENDCLQFYPENTDGQG